MAAQERGTAEESPDPARPPETLPGNRCELFGWACTEWDRLLRAAVLIVVVTLCLTVICLVAGRSGSEVIALLVSR